MSCPLCDCSIYHASHFVNEYHKDENTVEIDVHGTESVLTIAEARQLAMELLIATNKRVQ